MQYARIILVVLLSSFSYHFGMGQKVARYFSIGPSLSSYKGDFSGYNKFASGVEISLIQNKDTKIRGTFSFAAGSVIAQTTKNIYSGLSYVPLYFVQSRFMSVHYNFNYYILRKKHIKTYAGIGFGVFQFKPFDQYKNEIHSISNGTRPTNEDYELTRIMFPVQFGTIYTMKNDIGFRLNIKWMNTKTDYLDNMSKLANPNDNDNILMINLGLTLPIREPENTSTPVIQE